MTEEGHRNPQRRPSLFYPAPVQGTAAEFLTPLLSSASIADLSSAPQPWTPFEKEDMLATVRDLINDSVKVPVKMAHILRSTQLSVEIKKQVKAKMGRASVYATLVVCKQFRDDAEADRVNHALLQSRALYAEVLAILLVAEHDRLDALTEVLTHQWDELKTVYEPVQNALTVAVAAKATHFISDARVHETMVAVWQGNYVLNTRSARRLERQFGRARASGIIREQDIPHHRSRKFRLHWWKIKVPRYQYYTSMVIYFLWIFLYSYIVVRRTDTPTVPEYIFYVMALSFIAEDTKSLLVAHRTFDAVGLWNWIDYAGYTLFVISFLFRVMGVHSTDEDLRVSRMDTSYNVLSCGAVLIWFRTLELLNTFRTFGYLLITIRRMLKDAFNFFALIGVIILGFSQAFYGLAKGPTGGVPGSDRAGLADVASIVNLLLKGLMADPEYDDAARIHMIYGTVLYHTFLFISYLIFMNLLIAVFNSSYEQVRLQSEAEYQLLFAERTLEHIQRSHEVPFLPPANLLELLCLPLHLMVGAARLRALLEYVCAAIFLPELLAIAVFEFIYPPEVSSRIDNFCATNVAFETWRLDLECADGDGGLQGVGIVGASRRAMDPTQRMVNTNVTGGERQRQGSPAYNDGGEADASLLAVLARMEAKIDRLEQEARERTRSVSFLLPPDSVVASPEHSPT